MTSESGSVCAQVAEWAPAHHTQYLRQVQIIGSKKAGIPAPILDISSATLWRWVNLGRFPRPYKISEGVTVWSADEVRNWLAAQAKK